MFNAEGFNPESEAHYTHWREYFLSQVEIDDNEETKLCLFWIPDGNGLLISAKHPWALAYLTWSIDRNDRFSSYYHSPHVASLRSAGMEEHVERKVTEGYKWGSQISVEQKHLRDQDPRYP